MISHYITDASSATRPNKKYKDGLKEAHCAECSLAIFVFVQFQVAVEFPKTLTPQQRAPRMFRQKIAASQVCCFEMQPGTARKPLHKSSQARGCEHHHDSSLRNCYFPGARSYRCFVEVLEDCTTRYGCRL